MGAAEESLELDALFQDNLVETGRIANIITTDNISPGPTIVITQPLDKGSSETTTIVSMPPHSDTSEPQQVPDIGIMFAISNIISQICAYSKPNV